MKKRGTGNGPTPVKEMPADWTRMLIRGENNRAISNVTNLSICLEHHPAMRGALYFDEFSQDVFISSDAPSGFRQGPVDEMALIEIRCWLEQNFLSRVGKETVSAAVLKASQARRVHPVREYVKSHSWDGEERLKYLFPYYFGAPCEKEWTAEEKERKLSYWEAIARMFIISSLARIFTPGCQVDHTLVLEGEQGIGKSQALRTLFGSEWFSDQMPPLETKDASIQLAGKWCIEFAEYATLMRTDPATTKGFLTRQIDRYRPPYAAKASDVQRQCVFAATVNPEEYLTDTTGNRRSWPVRCGVIRLEPLARDRNQLWAEGYDRLQQKVDWWPDADMARIAASEQQAREITDPWVEPIGEWLVSKDCPKRITTRWVLDQLRVPEHSQTKANSMRVGEILRRKFNYRRRPVTGGSYYEKPEKADA